jgi:hypothetical protein
MTKFTVNELAYAKGTSEPVRQALLSMQAKLTAPWVSLTPEEILDLFDVNNVYGSKWVEFARAVEAKLKEKNHDAN